MLLVTVVLLLLAPPPLCSLCPTVPRLSTRRGRADGGAVMNGPSPIERTTHHMRAMQADGPAAIDRLLTCSALCDALSLCRSLSPSAAAAPLRWTRPLFPLACALSSVPPLCSSACVCAVPQRPFAAMSHARSTQRSRPMLPLFPRHWALALLSACCILFAASMHTAMAQQRAGHTTQHTHTRRTAHREK